MGRRLWGTIGGPAGQMRGHPSEPLLEGAPRENWMSILGEKQQEKEVASSSESAIPTGLPLAPVTGHPVTKRPRGLLIAS